MFGLKDQQKVEGIGDAKRPTITERSLAKGVSQDHGRGGGNRGRESDKKSGAFGWERPAGVGESKKIDPAP
jgi:hypothetical protein